MKKSILIFTILSLMAKVFAFGRELVLSNYYGAGEVSDVFLLAMTIPVNIFGFVSSGITSGFIPLYHKIDEEKGKERALLFCSQVTNLIVCLCIVIVLCFYIFSDRILRLFAVGFSDATMNLAVLFTRISIWSILAIALSSIFMSYLQINNRISVTAVSQIPQNIGVIITIFIAVIRKNIVVLPIGFLISSFLQPLFLMWFCVQAGYKYKTVISLTDEYVNAFLKGLGVLTISSSILQINILIDRTLATRVMVGGLSMFEYASNINSLFMGLTIIPISTALYPQLTKNESNMEMFTKHVLDGIDLFVVIMTPLTMYVCVFSKQIVSIIYSRGAFGETETILTSEILAYYALGLVAFAIREILSKVFYAKGDMKTPMINSAISLILNIVLNLLLIEYMGLKGLALATTLSAYVMMLLLWRSMKKLVIKDIFRSVIKELILSVGCSAVGIVISYYIYMINADRFARPVFMMTIVTAFFVCLYLALSLLTGNVRSDYIKSFIGKLNR